ncbi:hypothetical protein ON021_22565 [Microcoleus sp. HI-ES]|nr:hypothetical protein [Microcoleus sp. HI-ES]MCZ0902688.1 hypothetical protein [Microcoleus sp. HI-ES]
MDGEGWTFHTQQLLKLLAGDCLRCLTALVLHAGAVVSARTKPVAYNTTND